MEWFGKITDDIFNQCSWSLEKGLNMFANIYFKCVTPEYVKILIGLRSPQHECLYHLILALYLHMKH